MNHLCMILSFDKLFRPGQSIGSNLEHLFSNVDTYRDTKVHMVSIIVGGVEA